MKMIYIHRNREIIVLWNNQKTKNRSKIFRYLDGQNQYKEFNFFCSVLANVTTTSFLSDLKLKTTKFTESCRSGNTRHTNEYYVLPNTDIVLKSKQWVSPANKSFFTSNYYAFQQNWALYSNICCSLDTKIFLYR